MTSRRFEFHLDRLPTGKETVKVFEDPRKQRGKRLLRSVRLCIALVFAWLAAFVVSVNPVNQTPAGLSAKTAATFSDKRVLVSGGAPEGSVAPLDEATVCAPDAPTAFAAMAETPAQQRVFAHVPISLQWAHLSVRRSCGSIDVLVPDWITIAETPDGIRVDVASSDTRAPLLGEVQKIGQPVELMPRVQFKLLPITSKLDAKINDPRNVASLESDLAAALALIDAHGACLDLSQLPRRSVDFAQTLVGTIQKLLTQNQLQSCVILGWDDEEWLDQQSTSFFDHVILKAFYEPWVGSAPRPLSEDTWFADVVSKARSKVDPSRLVIALGNFAANWEAGVPLPERLPYGEGMALVAESGATLSFSPDTSGSFATFASNSGARQTLWMLDAASAFNQLKELDEQNVVNLAVWSLGLEDPGLWPLLTSRRDFAVLTSPQLTTVSLSDYVRYVGTGAALRIANAPQLGVRDFDLDPETGKIVEQAFISYPQPYTIQRYGQTKPNELILTFDDGPHADYTRRILDILKDTETPAAFFVLGRSVMSEPELLKRIYEEGHEIGAHTFSHPRMDQIADARTTLEHDLTDRIIASAVGRNTILYREPFLRSGGPISASRVPPLEVVQANGSMIFGMDVVPKDWTGLTSDEIAAYVISEVVSGNGNVILLHDGGEDRDASVEALPVIISELRRLGYEFTTVADAIGVSREELMPPADGFLPAFDKVSFTFASGTVNVMLAVFWIVLTIGLVRASIMFLLALLRRRHKVLPPRPAPKVAVIIPAFEEQDTIANCIESVLASRYKNLEIVVVNDGSMDNTLNEVLKFKHKPNVRVIIQPNQGKWAALNRALLGTDADIAVCIDADTQVEADAVEKLVRHFSDPKIGAVAGKVTVGNRNNLLTRLQALEYVVSQNFERLAFDRINGILVVPGALGAWRVSALKKAGLFCDDTLTEDSDLTMAVNRAGYRIVYEEQAVAQTEAPEGLRGLMTQRLRWSLGMVQAAWKHKVAMRERRAIGLFSIPDMFVFGYLFPLLAPIADLLVVLLAYNYLSGSWAGDVGSQPEMIPPNLIWAYAALPIVEFSVAAFAVFKDGKAPKSLLLLWPVQRLLYRPILYLSVYRAILRATSGSLAAWGRSKRKGHDFLLLEKTV